MEANSAIEFRLRQHETRLDANHDSIAALRDKTASHDTKISVITTELRETREDIGEMRTAMDKQRQEQKDEMAWVKRGLWAAAGTFLMFFVSSAALLVNLIGH